MSTARFTSLIGFLLLIGVAQMGYAFQIKMRVCAYEDGLFWDFQWLITWQDYAILPFSKRGSFEYLLTLWILQLLHTVFFIARQIRKTEWVVLQTYLGRVRVFS